MWSGNENSEQSFGSKRSSPSQLTSPIDSTSSTSLTSTHSSDWITVSSSPRGYTCLLDNDDFSLPSSANSQLGSLSSLHSQGRGATPSYTISLPDLGSPSDAQQLRASTPDYKWTAEASDYARPFSAAPRFNEPFSGSNSPNESTLMSRFGSICAVSMEATDSTVKRPLSAFASLNPAQDSANTFVSASFEGSESTKLTDVVILECWMNETLVVE